MSKKIYCVAQFEPKPGKEKELFSILQSLEPNTTREDGCIQYLVTRKIANDFATGISPLFVFNEIWKSKEHFEAHCQRKEIVNFFETQCLDGNGMVKSYNVCTYTDEPIDYDSPAI